MIETIVVGICMNVQQKQMKKTAIYMRVSSDKQVQEGDSIAAQRSALIKYINDRPDLTLAGEYLDDGVSGTKADRDELMRLLEDVKSGKVDLILVTKLDRLYRSIKHYLNMMEILDRYNVGWTAIWEPIYDTTTPQGRLIVNQMMSIAQFEAENTGQRIRQVFAYKMSQKEYCSGQTPPGYRLENKHLVPNADAPNVKEAFEIFARTGKLSDVQRITAGMSGIPSCRAAIKKMLKNSIYIGTHPSGIENFCEPIIPKELFYDVQRKLGMNIKSSQNAVYIFSGLIRCAECGRSFGAGTMRRKRGGGALEIRHRYRCPRHYSYHPPMCDNTKMVYETVMEKYLLGNLHELMRGAVLDYEAKAAPARDRSAQIAAIEKKMIRLKELFVNDLITIEEYKSDKEKYKKQIDELHAEQSVDPEVEKASVDSLRAILQMDINGIYQDLSPEERRRFWRGIIQSITVGKDRSIKVEFVMLSSGTK